jgi:hypothetical protein
LLDGLAFLVGHFKLFADFPILIFISIQSNQVLVACAGLKSGAWGLLQSMRLSVWAALGFGVS